MFNRPAGGKAEAAARGRANAAAAKDMWLTGFSDHSLACLEVQRV